MTLMIKIQSMCCIQGHSCCVFEPKSSIKARNLTDLKVRMCMQKCEKCDLGMKSQSLYCFHSLQRYVLKGYNTTTHW